MAAQPHFSRAASLLLQLFATSRADPTTTTTTTETSSVTEGVVCVPPQEKAAKGGCLPPEEKEPGPSLGQILGLVTIIITILYIIGISWKVIKIVRGEYEPSEPVYLKYK